MAFVWSRLRSPRVGVVVAAALAFWLTHLSLGYWSVDDAGITYAYSIGLADRGSLSPLPESMAVEGYSNPALFLFIALLRLLNLFDPITTHTKIEMVAFALMALLVYEILRPRFEPVTAVIGTAIFVVAELLTPATWLWYSSGLENVFVSLALILLLWLGDRASRRGTFHPVLVGLICFAVALVRPEAPVYVAAFYAALVLARAVDRPWLGHLSRLALAGTLTTGLYVGFLWWRHATYGVWFPNTYFAKLDGGANVLMNLRDYVVPLVFPYGFSLVFALSACVLFLLKPYRSFAIFIGMFITASLVMPLVGGNDLMGEHRFATPFFAVSHIAGAFLFCAVYAMMESISEPLARRTLLALVLLPAVALTVVGIAGRGLTPNSVTIAKVVELHGVRRMQHQRRLGLINPVVIAPDAGGVLLFGSLQHIDNGYLTDFQMAHMLRGLPNITQYQTVERMADLANNNASWPFDRTLIGSQYLAHKDQHMFARSDLVELPAPPPVAPFHEQAGVRLYLSPDNVLVAGPRGLVRIEIVVAWDDTKAAQELALSAVVADDKDHISLAPYGDIDGTPKPTGVQRRALLVRAPTEPGTYNVAFGLMRESDAVWSDRPLAQIQVLQLDSIQSAVDAILGAPQATPEVVAKRFAWLREQLLPRLSHEAFRREQKGLVVADIHRARRSARHIRNLIWDARLAALTDDVPASLRVAEQRVIERVLDQAACAGVDGEARRTLCIGREVDRLRRYGYFGALRRMPAIRAELERVAANLARLDPDEQYIALVGLSLAMPDRIEVQKALLRARDRYVSAAAWPSLEL